MATKTKAELEVELAELKAQLAAVLAQNNNTTATVVSEPVAPTVAPTYSAPTTSDVSIVYTSHSLGFMSGTSFNLNCTRYGEEFCLSRSQADELVGKYRHWFDKGILAVSYRNVDYAIAKGVKTDKEIGLTIKKLEKLGKMTVTELEDLWNSLTLDTHRSSLCMYFKEKFIEGAAGFQDRAKVDLLNRLTNGGFDAEAQQLSGRPVKIEPTDLMLD